MAALGGLVVSLSLAYTHFQDGLDKAGQLAKNRSELMRRAFVKVRRGVNAAGRAVVAFSAAVAGTGAVALHFTRQQIDAADAAGKLAQSLGVAVEELTALNHWASLNGMNADSLKDSIKDLNKSISEAADGTGSKAQRFKQLGIEVAGADGKLKSVGQVLPELAQRFSKMKDGPEKTALAMELMGENGLKMIPGLNAGKDAMTETLAEAERLGLTVSDEFAEQSALFNDNVYRAGTTLQGLANIGAAELVPVLNETFEAFMGAGGGAGELLEEAKKLAADGSIKEWARTSVTGLSYFADGLHGIVKIVTVAGKQVGAFAAASAALLRGDFRGAIQVGKDYLGEMSDIFSGELVGVGLRRRLEELGKPGSGAGAGGAADDAAQGAAGLPENAAEEIQNAAAQGRKVGAAKGRAAAKAQVSAYQRWLDSMVDKVGSFGLVTELEKINYDIDAGKLGKLTEAEKAHARELAAGLDAKRAAVELEKQQTRAAEEAAKARQAAAQSVADYITEQRKSVALLGVTDAAQRLLIERRHGGYTNISDKAFQSMLAVTAETQRATQAHERLMEVQQAQQEFAAASYARQADMARQLGDTMRSSIDRFTDALAQGRLDFKSFAGSIVQDLVRMQMKAAMAPLTRGLMSGLSSLFSNAIGGDPLDNFLAMNNNFQAFAKGGVPGLPDIGSFTNRVVDKPTFFAFARGAGVMGEKGREVIMPLRRMASGNMGVEAAAGGSSVAVHVHNNGSNKVDVQQRQEGGGLRLDVIIEQIDQAMGGRISEGQGAVSAAISNRFGLAPTMG